jgi:hypothetical protein
MIVELGKIKRSKSGEPSLVIRGLAAFLEQIAEEYLSSKNHEEEDVIVAVSKQRKDMRTLKQLGYLYAHLAPLAKGVLNDAGWNIASKEEAITELKFLLKFTKTIENETEDVVRVIPLSLSFQARTNRKKVNQFIDDIFFWLIEQGARPMTSEEYKKMKKL